MKIFTFLVVCVCQNAEFLFPAELDASRSGAKVVALHMHFAR